MKYIFTYLSFLGADPIIIGENQRWSFLPYLLSNCVFEMARKVTHSDNPEMRFNGKNYTNVISQLYIEDFKCDYIFTDTNILLKAFRDNTQPQPWYWLSTKEVKTHSTNDLDFYRNTFGLHGCSTERLKKFIKWIKLCLSGDDYDKEEFNFPIFPIEKWTNFTFDD